MSKNKLEPLVKSLLFSKRGLWVALFAIVTAIMAYFMSQLRIDASFEKNIPLKHEYMQTYLEYQEEFGGANRVFVALESKDGEIFTEEFFEALRVADDRVEGIEGVNQSQVQSLYSPSVRYIEASELLAGGAAGKRHCLPNSRMMIHQPLGGFQGQASDIAIHAQEIYEMKKRLNGILAHHCDKPIEQVEKDTDRDNFLSAEEAVKYGLVDSIINSRKQD